MGTCDNPHQDFSIDCGDTFWDHVFGTFEDTDCGPGCLAFQTDDSNCVNECCAVQKAYCKDDFKSCMIATVGFSILPLADFRDKTGKCSRRKQKVADLDSSLHEQISWTVSMDSRNSKVLIMMVNSMDECLEVLNVRDQTQERFFSCLHFLCSNCPMGFCPMGL